MARPPHGTGPLFAFLGMCAPMSNLHLLFLLVFGVQGTVATYRGHITVRSSEVAHTNSCTITWGSSPAPQPTLAVYERVTNLWMLGSAPDDNSDVEDMDDREFERYRMDMIKKTIHWAECLVNDWPELDLPWCLADWHDGKLVPESR